MRQPTRDDGLPRLPLKLARTAQRLDCSCRQIYTLVEQAELELVRQGRSSFRSIARLRRKAAAGRC